MYAQHKTNTELKDTYRDVMSIETPRDCVSEEKNGSWVEQFGHTLSYSPAFWI